MIIDAKTIVITLVVVVLAFTYGLKLIRSFALQIAQENHDAVLAMDHEEEQARLKKERAADQAAATAFAKVEPLLFKPTSSTTATTPTTTTTTTTTTTSSSSTRTNPDPTSSKTQAKSEVV